MEGFVSRPSVNNAPKKNNVTRRSGGDMEENIKFSILIPAYNCRNLILSTVQSVMNQTYRNFEIIIIDDASTDDTGWYVDRLRDLHRPLTKVVHRSENRGPTSSLIRGQWIADGDVMVQVDGDGDIIEPNTLELYAKEYQDPETWLCGSMLDIKTKGQRIPSPQFMFNNQCNRFGGVQQFQPRSWRKWLWYKVPNQALRNPWTNEYWRSCSDASFLWVMWELAGRDRVAYVWKPLYVHNHDNPLNMFKDEKMRKERDGFFDYIRSLQPYQRLESRDSEPETVPKETHFEWAHRNDLKVELDIKQ